MNIADVVIVGGGIAGASLAFRLAGRCRVVLLEAEPQPGYHASGRSAALFSASYGAGPVRALADASREFLLHPPAAFGEPPLASPRGVLWLAREDQAAALAALRAQLAGGQADLQDCPVDEAERRCPALRPGYAAAAALETGAFDIDVHALLQGYLRAFRAAGGELRSGAAVTAIHRRGGAWQVDTAAERYQCALLVNAAGAWADQVAALAGVAPIGLVPKRRTAISFDPLGVAGGTPLSRWPCVIDVEEAFYFKPDAGRVLASPADETPAPPGDAQAEELDVAMAVDRIERATCLRVERIAARWAGLRSFVADGVPVAGMDPDAAGFFWLAAQGGYGIMTSPALSALAAAFITADTQSSDPLAAALSPLRLQRTPTAAKESP